MDVEAAAAVAPERDKPVRCHIVAGQPFEAVVHRNRKFADSPLEEAVCCEPVSEMELGKSGFWGSDGKMDPFPRLAYLSDCYYAYFSNSGIAAAADFAVYQTLSPGGRLI